MLSERLKKLSKNLNDLDPKVAADALRKLAAEIEDDEEIPESEEFKGYRQLLTRMKSKDSLKKLKIFIDQPRLRKPILWWLLAIDKGEGAGTMDFQDLLRKINILLHRDLPSAKFLKMFLDYGVANGFIALDRILSKNRAKITLMKEQKV
jgi:hypothetical protein